jgi:hypothetical protein
MYDDEGKRVKKNWRRSIKKIKIKKAGAEADIAAKSWIHQAAIDKMMKQEGKKEGNKLLKSLLGRRLLRFDMKAMADTADMPMKR